MKHPRLWAKIQAFELDDEHSEFTFTERLARDNDWSVSYGKEVVEEYKKFIYLCCCDYGEITPSDAVDQAWHLHLTYTKSYWVDLCRNTLGREIHHNPTKGGSKENAKYSSCYDSIIEVYEAEFCQKPPVTIWPSNEARFSDINFKRINLSNYWLIEKRKSKLTLSIPLLVVLLLGLFIESKDQFPWVAFVIVAIAVLFMIRAARGKGGGGSGSGGAGCSFMGCSGDSGCSSSGCSSGCGGD